MEHLSEFILKDYNICVSNSIGPQVGNKFLRMDLTNDVIFLLPFGICVTNTQGQIKYIIQQAHQNKLRDLEVDREVVTLVTQALVYKNDKSIITQ